MMRQAVPLLRPEAPIVGTGIEAQLVRDSRTQIVAERAGEVVFVDATSIKIRYDRTDDELFVSFEDPITTYSLPKFRKTNQSTTIDLRLSASRVSVSRLVMSSPKGTLPRPVNSLSVVMSRSLICLGRVTTMRMLSC